MPSKFDPLLPQPPIFTLLMVLFLASCSEGPAKEDEIKAAAAVSETALADRLAYSEKTFLGDYLEFGDQSGTWIAAATNGLAALARGRITQATNDLWSAFHALNKAVNEGCADPIVLYSLAHLRHRDGAKANSAQAAEWVSAAERLETSRYSALRKAWGALRAAQALKAVATNTPPEVVRWREKVLDRALMALEETDIPSEEVYALVSTYMELLQRNPPQHSYAFDQLWPVLSRKFPRSAEVWLIRGRYFIDYAWDARGSGYSDTVTAEGWKLMKERLAVAEDALEKSWKLRPSEEAAVAMIRLELGQGRGRKRMEGFFERAMLLNPKSYDACWQKLYYLYPRWYGSPEQMLEFAWECVHSKTWGGTVPLIMLDVQDELARLAYPETEERHKYSQFEGFLKVAGLQRGPGGRLSEEF